MPPVYISVTLSSILTRVELLGPPYLSFFIVTKPRTPEHTGEKQLSYSADSLFGHGPVRQLGFIPISAV